MSGYQKINLAIVGAVAGLGIGTLVEIHFQAQLKADTQAMVAILAGITGGLVGALTQNALAKGDRDGGGDGS